MIDVETESGCGRQLSSVALRRSGGCISGGASKMRCMSSLASTPLTISSPDGDDGRLGDVDVDRAALDVELSEWLFRADVADARLALGRNWRGVRALDEGHRDLELAVDLAVDGAGRNVGRGARYDLRALDGLEHGCQRRLRAEGELADGHDRINVGDREASALDGQAHSTGRQRSPLRGSSPRARCSRGGSARGAPPRAGRAAAAPS